MIKKIISIFLAIQCLFVSAYAFTDVSENEWYSETIRQMESTGLINGYDDNTFRPNDTISYAEFITIVKRCKTGNASSGSGEHWASQTMKYAYDNHWYDYDEINSDLYDSPIPRYMAAKIIALGMDVEAIENNDNNYWKYMNSIHDFNSINGRYAYLVIRDYCNGILTGDDNGNFNPNSNLTRAEASAIILRANYGSSNNQPTYENPTIQPTVPTDNNINSGGVSANGKLGLIGNKLCNCNGEVVALRGMSTHGLQWFPSFTNREFLKLTADYGANVIRLAVYTAENGYISQPDNLNQLIDNAVNNAIAEDMYIIIDWHILSDGNPMTYIEQSKNFFANVSSKYAEIPNVLYEICNEPNGNVTWKNDVKPYAETIIPIIRENSADSIILVGSPNWSQNINDPADDPLNYGNVMYTCHFYAGTHGEWLRERIDYALSKGIAVFISEWGTSAADGSGGVFIDASSVWMDFMKDRNLSWCNWSLCDKAESSAALNGDGTLSESGEFVFSYF